MADAGPAGRGAKAVTVVTILTKWHKNPVVCQQAANVD